MRHQRLLAAGALFAATFLLWAGAASAQTFRSGNSITIGKGEVIDSSLWSTGQSLDLAGDVNGDVYCAGQTVVISGTVKGDVLCAAQTVTVSGTVEGDLRAMAQTVTVTGKIQGSTSMAGQSIHIQADAVIGQDASFAGNDISLNGQVGRDMAVAANSTHVNGQVGRNIKATVENLSLGNRAKVAGAIDYTSRNDAQRAQSAEITGAVTRHDPPEEDRPSANYGQMFGLSFTAAVYLFVSLLLMALALVLLFPAVFDQAALRAIQSPWKTLLIGFLATLIAPVVIAVLLVSLIGAPLGLLLALLWVLVAALSGPFFAYFLGRLLWRGQTNIILLMLGGTSILLISYFIPFVGIITALAAYWMGSGIFLRETMRRTPRPVYDTVDSEPSRRRH